MMNDSGQIIHISNNLGLGLEVNKRGVKEATSNPSHQIETQIEGILTEINQRDFNGARKNLKRLLRKTPKSPAVWNIKGIFEVESLQHNEAAKSFKKVIQLDPNAYAGYSNLAKLLLETGKIDEATTYLEKSLQKLPQNPNLNYLFGRLEYHRENYQGAIEYCKKALKHKPDFPEALITLGNGLRQLNNLEQAKKCFKMSLQLNSNSAEALSNLGACYVTEEDFDTALTYFDRACEINPKLASLHNNLGNCYHSLGNSNKAIESFERALSINPDLWEGHFNISALFIEQNNHKKAFEHLFKILQKFPDDKDALNNIAVLMLNIGRPEQALKFYKRLMSLKGFPESKNAKIISRNVGNAHRDLGQLEEALSFYENAVQIDPNYTDALLSAMSIKQIFCDWEEKPELVVRQSLIGIEGEPAAPFHMLRYEDNAENQLLRSENWGHKIFPLNVNKWVFNTHNVASKKIKIGYFGADFFDHATMFLMLGLLRNHDSNKFEIYIFSYGHNEKGAYGQEVQSYCTEFFDIQSSSDEEVIELAHKVGLNIAIDLKGYTKNTRSHLFAHNLAPVQINYLGYPSTMGVDCIHYIIADKTIIPEHYQKYYSEKIIWMPDSYQPNDNKRKISPFEYSRSDFGLPEEKIILCCHNQLYKVSPIEFDIWMNILQQNNMCVLWLLGNNENANRNILKEASNRGIDRERIIFCKPIKHADHLARLKLADLFLDTFFVNAHTTASDALWAGVPVVTKIGEQFAARVAASLLRAVGLDELVVETNHEYESLISELIANPKQLKEIKKKLRENIKTEALFDTEKYTKNFEKALELAWEQFRAGANFDHIQI